MRLGGRNGQWPFNIALAVLNDNRKGIKTPRFKWPRHSDISAWLACAHSGKQRGNKVDFVARSSLFQQGSFLATVHLATDSNNPILHCIAIVNGVVLDSMFPYREMLVKDIPTRYSDVSKIYFVARDNAEVPNGFGPPLKCC